MSSDPVRNINDSSHKNITLFERLRAIAIIIILFHHLPAHSIDYYKFTIFQNYFDLHWLNHLNRYFALSIFTFISGYLLEYRNPSIKTGNDLRLFFCKRIIRIYPLYFLALIIFLMLFHDIIGANFCTILSNFFCIQLLVSHNNCWPIFTLWYIGLIMIYYCSFAFGKYLENFLLGIPAYFFIFTVLVIIFSFLKLTFGLGDKRVVLYLPIFITGILSAKENILTSFKPQYFRYACCALVISIICYLIYVYPPLYLTDTKPALFSFLSLQAFFLTNAIMISFVYFIVYILSKHNKNDANGVIKATSYASFSTYLFHRPVWWFINSLFHFDDSRAILLFMIVIGIPFALVVGFYIQKFYDYYVARKLYCLLIANE